MNATHRYLRAGVTTEHRPAIRDGYAMAERVERPQAVRVPWARRIIRGRWELTARGAGWLLLACLLLSGMVL